MCILAQVDRQGLNPIYGQRSADVEVFKLISRNYLEIRGKFCQQRNNYLLGIAVD